MEIVTWEHGPLYKFPLYIMKGFLIFKGAVSWGHFKSLIESARKQFSYIYYQVHENQNFEFSQHIQMQQSFFFLQEMQQRFKKIQYIFYIKKDNIFCQKKSRNKNITGTPIKSFMIQENFFFYSMIQESYKFQCIFVLKFLNLSLD